MMIYITTAGSLKLSETVSLNMKKISVALLNTSLTQVFN